jgi:hypothetical protein
MQPDESSGAGDGKERDLYAWLEVLAPAVEMLLRYTEQQLDQDVQAAFAAGQTSTVLLRQLQRDQARQFREHLAQLRSAQTAEGGC